MQQQYANINIVNTVPPGVSGGYNMQRRVLQRTVHFINGVRVHRGAMMRSWGLYRHRLMQQLNNAQPHVARICALFF